MSDSPPSTHARVSLPTRIAAPSGTERPTWIRSRVFVGPQCGCSREPADCTEKYAEPITIVFTSGPSEASSFADRGARNAPGCSEPDMASVTSDQRPLTSAGEW